MGDTFINGISCADEKNLCTNTKEDKKNLNALQFVNLNVFFFCLFAVPITSAEGVFAKQALLPCDIAPMERNDAVYMVLWFRDGEGEPLYR